MITRILLVTLCGVLFLPQESEAATCYDCSYEKAYSGEVIGDIDCINSTVAKTCTGKKCGYNWQTASYFSGRTTVKVKRSCYDVCPSSLPDDPVADPIAGSSNINNCCNSNLCNTAGLVDLQARFIYGIILVGSTLVSTRFVI